MGFLDMFSRRVSPGTPSFGTPADNRSADRQKRLRAYKRTWEAYLAELPDPLVKEGASNDNVKVNPVRAVVNTGVYFLFGQEVKFQVSPDTAEKYGKGASETRDTGKSPKEDSKAEEIKKTPQFLKDLNLCWKRNNKQSFLIGLGLSGAIHGTPFVKFVPNGAGLNNEYPRLVLLDPANVDVEWNPDDCTEVVKYSIEYVTEDPETGKHILRIQEITADKDENDVTYSWTMQDYEHRVEFINSVGYLPAPGEKTPVGPPKTWPYAWAPIEHCQNIELPHVFWGLPDIDETSVQVVESIQRAASSLNKIVRIHASPRLFAKNVMPDQLGDIDVSADNIIALPNMDADLEVLQTLQNLGPGIQFVDKLKADWLEMIQVPPIALGKFEGTVGSSSGVQMSIEYAPILQKNDMKRISYGGMLERINAKMLMLMGYADPEEYEGLVIVWPEAMPGAEYLERQTVQQDQQMGLSRYTTMQRLGYDPVEEEKRRNDEAVAELKATGEAKLELQKQAQEQMPAPAPGQPQPGGQAAAGKPAPKPGQPKPGGNNNPSGYGNQNGSLGGTKAAGTPKTPQDKK